MYEQTTLFFDENEEHKMPTINKSKPQKIDRRSNPVGTVVYLYVIEDIATRRLYIGISNNPYSRFEWHKSGKSQNAKLNAVASTRSNDLRLSIRAGFFVEDYRSKGYKSRAHAVESFVIAYYDTLRTGFNRKYIFHHDFRDSEFWLNILPPEFLDLYRNVDHEWLNENVRSFIPKRRVERRHRKKSLVNSVLKQICLERIMELSALDIKLGTIVKQKEGLSRSNLHRFTHNELQYVSPKRMAKVINVVEKHLGLQKLFNLKEELIKKYPNGL